MKIITYEDLIKNGVHYGHLVSKWNPAMKPYIFGKKQGIHIIDVVKTKILLERAMEFAKKIARNGGQILYVGTKKQAKDILRKYAEEVEMPYVVERWLGGTLTNLRTIRKSVETLKRIEQMKLDGTYDKLNKKERLMLERKRQKMEKILSGLVNMERLPQALFVVDIVEEHIAVHEANKLDIPVIAMVDTNADPNIVDYPIPSNDDAIQSIEYITSAITDAIKEGIQEREQEEEIQEQIERDLEG